MSWSRGLARPCGACARGALAAASSRSTARPAHPGLVEDLRAIEVAPIKDRIGHYLADNLTTDLNGTGQTSTPKYQFHGHRLDLHDDADSQRADQHRNLRDLDRRSKYTLSKADGGAQVLSGVANAAAAYDRSQQRYNDLRAARDAEIRLARRVVR